MNAELGAAGDQETAASDATNSSSYTQPQKDSAINALSADPEDAVSDVSEDDAMEDSVEETMETEDNKRDGSSFTETKVFLPGVDAIAEDEELEYDSSAYDMYYAMSAEWPALSIDIIRDDLGNCRTQFPLSITMVAGSQAPTADKNHITIMKMENLSRIRQKEHLSDSENESDSDNDMHQDPTLTSRVIPHEGAINRIRSMPQESHIVVTWTDKKKVFIWDLKEEITSLNGKHSAENTTTNTPISTFHGHPDEGFAMDWSPVTRGNLLTGDCSKFIYLWNAEASDWRVDKVPFIGHASSIEDLQWSPNEASVFASCSSDRTVRIWDTRKKAGSMLDVMAHDDDVNVISWNRNVTYLLASGSDDGSFKIWDLRHMKADGFVAHFRYHLAPITSLEWHPSDESVIAVAGADNQLSIWDLSVEEDTDMKPVQSSSTVDVPPQLLFIHQGQKDIKELHFHPQCPGVLTSTAGDGFNVFKPANIS